MSKPKRIIILPRILILAVIALVLIMGLWVFIRGQFITSLTNNIQQMKSEGYQINHDKISVKGFPFKVVAVTNTLSITSPASIYPAKKMALKTNTLQVSSATFSPLSWTLHHTGNMHIDMRSPMQNHYSFYAVPANWAISVAVNLKGHLKSAKLDLTQTRLEPLFRTSPFIQSFNRFKADLNVKKGNGIFHINGDDIVVADTISEPVISLLGTHMKHLSVNGAIENIQTMLEGEAGDWQAKGAGFKFDSFYIVWGELDLNAKVDMKFQNNKASGMIILKLANVDALYKKIRAADLLAPEENTLIRMAITTMPKDEDGRIELVLPIKNNQLTYFGQVIADFTP